MVRINPEEGFWTELAEEQRKERALKNANRRAVNEVIGLDDTLKNLRIMDNFYISHQEKDQIQKRTQDHYQQEYNRLIEGL